MKNTLLKLFSVSGISLKQIATVTIYTILLAVLEGLGASLLFPILEYVEGGGIQNTQGGALKISVKILEFIGISPNIGGLIIVAMVPLILRQIVYLVNISLVSGLSAKTTSALRAHVSSAFIKADIPFFLAHERSEMINAVLNEAARAGGVLTQSISLLNGAFMLLIYIALLMILTPTISISAIPLFCLVYFLFSRGLRHARRFGMQISAANAQLSRGLTQALSAVRLIKMRSTEALVIHDITEEINKIKESTLGAEVNRHVMQTTSQLFLTVGVFAILYVAIDLLHMKLADLGMFGFLIMRTIPLVTQINTDRSHVLSQLGGYESIAKILNEADIHTTITSGSKAFDDVKKSICYRDVVFGYGGPSGQTILNKLNFHVNANETVALVGRSGAGKSTTVDLLARFFDPIEGLIEIDGIPIRDFNLRSLRARIAYVTQEAQIFTASIRDNLLYGINDHVSDFDIREALRMSHADEFVGILSDGIDTLVGEGSNALSGGQRQRLALARALLAKPSILILDEPTSALDSESEEAIQAALAELKRRLTIIIIAHRFSTIRQADKVIVLEKGAVTASGSHEQMFADSPAYRRLFETQFGTTETAS